MCGVCVVHYHGITMLINWLIDANECNGDINVSSTDFWHHRQLNRFLSKSQAFAFKSDDEHLVVKWNENRLDFEKSNWTDEEKKKKKFVKNSSEILINFENVRYQRISWLFESFHGIV